MGSGSLLMAVSFFYNLGIAPVVFALVSEIPSSRLRTKSIILARNAYNMACIVTAVLICINLNSENGTRVPSRAFLGRVMFCHSSLGRN
ncbi:AKR_HP2_G0022520.mRNA.1.CDS.1 [Saccharomyces cerevisiae]|nr:AKR_HP2_G0022520.mRNA.1.CDS.1 [Saccharomyces cerevisiae]CAI6529374.1 AKR_HP2_G0022520.mRNA.1.CDS.1 [Saccharomyces cerevisiae]